MSSTNFQTPLALLVAGVVVIFIAARSADSPESEQVSALLSQVKAEAALLSQDASAIEEHTQGASAQSRDSWDQPTVESMKMHINEANLQLAALAGLRKSASPWQITAIDRVTPLLKELADNNQTVIRYVNNQSRQRLVNESKNHVEANAEVSSKLSSLITDLVDYGNTKQRLETAKLELSIH